MNFFHTPFVNHYGASLIADRKCHGERSAAISIGYQNVNIGGSIGNSGDLSQRRTYRRKILCLQII